MIVFRCGACMLAVFVLCHSGCSASLPTYSWNSPEEAMAIIQSRVAAINTVEAPCTVVLTSPHGDSVSLEGAVVARNPGWLRIRAWKFNTAVFDLTMTPEGVWIMQNDSPELKGRLPTGIDAHAIARGWYLLSGHSFEDRSLTVADRHDNEKLIVTWPEQSDVQVSCLIERKTLLPEAFFGNESSRSLERFEVVLDDYRLVDGIAWPYTVRMTSDAGTAVLRLHSVALNQELSTEAFTVPISAVKQP